jgi:MFS family permease
VHDETPEMAHARDRGPLKAPGTRARRLRTRSVRLVSGAAAMGVPREEAGLRLSLVLAAAMFVLVVDTSLMNVSIAAAVKDLDTTVSAVQSAIALEPLVSAAFILIASKLGDRFGRKRAYVVGQLAYATGAVAMTLAQSLTAIIIFLAIIGGLGASLLLPAMHSLIHGNFEGAAQKKTYALIGAAAAIAAAVGPLLGGFVTTYLSWRVGFLFEVVVIAIVLSQLGLLEDVLTRETGTSTRSAQACPSAEWAAWCWASSCGRREATTSCC